LGATFSPQEKARVEAKPTNNPAAYDAYLRGRAFAAGSPFDKPPWRMRSSHIKRQ
jgi:hypothetical protein